LCSSRKVGSPSLVFFLSSNPLEIVLPYGSKKVLEGIMKKFLAIMAALFLISGSVSALGTTLNVGGTVADNLTVAIMDEMALTFTGVGGAAAGDVTSTLHVVSNKKNWTISFHSAHAGKLVNGLSGAAASEIDYFLQVAITMADFDTGFVKVNALDSAVQLDTDKTIVGTINGKTKKAGTDMIITASVPAQADTEFLRDSTAAYTDTVTVSIVSP
jgi:hypothetical protein